MSFDRARLGGLIPRLAQQRVIEEAIVESFGADAPDIISALASGTRIDDGIAEELQAAVWQALNNTAHDVLTFCWDTNAPGCSGAAWVSECAGVYIVTSSDWAPLGPFASLRDALECECFSITTSNPELQSGVLPVDDLLAIASGVVDWENDGSIVINGVEFEASQGELRRHAPS